MLNQSISFGPFRLDPRDGLARGGRSLPLTPKALALLCFLAGHRGRLVTKDELFDSLWPGAAVGDAALVTCIQELRQTLKDDARVASIVRITGDNFRPLQRLFSQIGRILQVNHLSSITREVVEAARECLVIGAT
jgi:DNA-binding response OmpR family regulator